jgi:hypothetical protein
MARLRRTRKNRRRSRYLGVTLRDNVGIVEHYAHQNDWSYSQAADRLVRAGAECLGIIGITLTKQTEEQVEQ